MIIAYSILTGGNRVWVHEGKDGQLKVKKCRCRFEGAAVLQHLRGLDRTSDTFHSQACARLNKINMGLRA